MENTKQDILIGASTILNYDLLGQGGYETQITSLEKEIGEGFVEIPTEADLKEPEEELGRKIRCNIKEMEKEITEIVKEYEKQIDRTLPAKVQKFELRLEKDSKPVNLKPRPVPIHLQEEVSDKLRTLLHKGFIRRGKSGFSAPLSIQYKKSGEIRLCIDYRRLNAITINESYATPSPDELFRALEGYIYFAAIDLKSGYYNVGVKETSQDKLAFSTPLGTFLWSRMPFGLKTAPSHFQEIMTKVLSDIIGRGCYVYLDDILVMGKTKKEFIKNVKEVMDRLGMANLIVNYEKTDFATTTVKYLGFEVSGDGRKIKNERIEAIEDLHPVTTKKGVQKLIGCLNYIRSFIPDYSRIASPISDLLATKGEKVVWMEAQSKALEELKELVRRRITLQHPCREATFIVRTDGSTKGIGGGIWQKRIGSEKEGLVALFSKKFSKVEANWSVIEQECFAVVYAITKNRYLLMGKKFIVETDHKNLIYLYKSEVPKLIRWKLQLAPYDMEIRHIPGKTNGFADFLSRVGAQDTVETCLVEVEEQDEPKDDDKLIRDIHERLGHAGSGMIENYCKRKEIKIENLKGKAKNIVRQCLKCQKLKSIKPRGHGTLRAFGTWLSVSVDTIGPCDMDEKEFRYLLVLVDDFTRFTLIAPLKSVTVDETIILLRKWFAMFGKPYTLRSDGGKQFTGGRMQEWLKGKGIEQKTTLPYDHEANGRVERVNREIRKIQRIWNMENDPDLGKLADLAMETLNQRIHSITRVQPFYGMFLREGELVETDSTEIQRGLVLKGLDKEVVSDKILMSDDKRETSAIEPEKFEIGEKILLSKPKQGKKEKAPLNGPFIVKEKITDNKYKVVPVKGGEEDIIPVRRMVKYVEDPFVSEKEEISINGKDEEEYIVEKILRHRHGGKLPIKFLVKWKNYTEEHNTWEYFPTVEDCEALDKYLEGNKALKGKLDKGQTNIKVGEKIQ
ncbi:Transposon Tf2-6 polyprotein [Aduncisulcus paluster]|uniref:Transposon Tf2-6 polyprotein n=1 Tax=Aduncisulcus paluster TaxID=2918883 RepID=A0ABQ5KGU2_9EUKA|nr:Transposon Tf2-6 polyprotein [Aduncisulcus paluster]